MKSERHKLPSCDRDWFLDNGLWLMNAIGYSIALDHQNNEAIRELEKCKEVSRIASHEEIKKENRD